MLMKVIWIDLFVQTHLHDLIADDIK